MKRLLPVFFVTIIFLLLSRTFVFASILEVCLSGGGCTYEYTGGGASNAIQTAIDAAGNGDTVYIYNGTYASPQIDMTSSHVGITIEGQSTSGVILNESYFRIGSAINGASSNITVKNLHIKDSYDVNNGLEIVNSTGIVLRNLLITGSGGEGVKITGNATVDIYNCYITTGNATGVRINGSGVEIDMYNTSINSNTYQGILVEDVNVLNVINSGIESNGSAGIQVNGGTTIVIKNNNVYGNSTYGMSVSSVTSLTNDYNNVYGNTSGGYTGSIVAGSHSISVDPDTGEGGIPNCTSDLINAGDPSITDVDGTISDIGIYGGPYSGFDGENYLCSTGLFCYVTDSAHSCIECLSNTDCPENYTCNTGTNLCEAPEVVDDSDDDINDDTEDDTEDDNTDNDTNLPNTSIFSDDPVFYSIFSIFMIITGYMLYAQKKYGDKGSRH